MGILCCILAAVLIAAVCSGAANIVSNELLYFPATSKITLHSVLQGLQYSLPAIILPLLVGLLVYKSRRPRRWAWGSVLACGAAQAAVLLFWKVAPVSDFQLTYDLSAALYRAAPSEWGSILNRIGTDYNGLWSAHLPFIIYQTLVFDVFGKSVQALQAMNLAASVLTCFLTVHTAKSLFGEKAGALAGWLFALNPTILFFVPVLTNQHIAALFFVLGLWVYFRRPFEKQIKNGLFCGAALALSQLMRPEMYVVLIALAACLVYQLLHRPEKKRALEEMLFVVALLAAFFGCIGLLDVVLIQSGTIHGSLLSGNIKYKLAIGLNQETHGLWSAGDAALLYDPDALDTVLSSRLSNPASIVLLMVKKVLYQMGSFSYSWSYIDRASLTVQKLYICISQAGGSVLALASTAAILLRPSHRKKQVLLLVIMAGFICTFSLIEVQARYNFLFFPLFALAASGLFAEKKLDRP